MISSKFNKLMGFGLVAAMNAVAFSNQSILTREILPQDKAANVSTICTPGTTMLTPVALGLDWMAEGDETPLIAEDTPIQFLASKTPGMLDPVGAVAFSIVGAPGAMLGNISACTMDAFSSSPEHDDLSL